MKARPAWLQEGWLLLARSRAAQGEYHEAMQLAQRFGPKPPVPNLQTKEPLAALEREFFLARTDLPKGLMLYSAQRRAGQTAEALETVRKLSLIPAAPYYLKAIEADTRRRAGPLGGSVEGLGSLSDRAGESRPAADGGCQHRRARVSRSPAGRVI